MGQCLRLLQVLDFLGAKKLGFGFSTTVKSILVHLQLQSIPLLVIGCDLSYTE